MVIQTIKWTAQQRNITQGWNSPPAPLLLLLKNKGNETENGCMNALPVAWWWWQPRPHRWSSGTVQLISAHLKCQGVCPRSGNPGLPSRRPSKTAWSSLPMYARVERLQTCEDCYKIALLMWLYHYFHITAHIWQCEQKPTQITNTHLEIHTVLLWSSPDHSIIRAAEQEANGHDCQIVIHILKHTDTHTPSKICFAYEIKWNVKLVALTTGDQPEPLWCTCAQEVGTFYSAGMHTVLHTKEK